MCAVAFIPTFYVLSKTPEKSFITNASLYGADHISGKHIFLPIFNGATIKILIRGQGKMYSQGPSVEGRKRKNIKDQK